MKIKHFFTIFTKKGATGEAGRFSDFFLHAPVEKKIEVFKEAAQKANEEQREVLRQSRLKTKTI